MVTWRSVDVSLVTRRRGLLLVLPGLADVEGEDGVGVGGVGVGSEGGGW